MFSNKNGYIWMGPELLQVCGWGVNYQNFVFYEIELRKVSLPQWTVKELKADVSGTSLSF